MRMRFRRSLQTLVALLATLLAGATAAGGALRPGPGATGSAGGAAVKLASCEQGKGSEGGSAKFVGRMRALSSGGRMSMRFTLLERLGDGEFTRVSAPGLEVWRKSRPGTPRFRYAQTVAALMNGGSYRALVDFRWHGQAGQTVRSTRRSSEVCRQPGGAPNLVIGGIEAAPGSSTEAPLYAVRVVNEGRSEARQVAVLLSVDGNAVGTSESALLGPGASERLIFAGPPCQGGVSAVADPGKTIRESAEGDNVKSAPCPSQPGR